MNKKLTIPKIKNLLTQYFEQFDYIYKNKDIIQIFLPVYYNDGNAVNIYIVGKPDGFYITDYAMARMRLSFISYEGDSWEQDFNWIEKFAQRNFLMFDHGRLMLKTSSSSIEIIAKDITRYANLLVQLEKEYKGLK